MKCYENLINFTGCLAYYRNLAEESEFASLSEEGEEAVVRPRQRYGEAERANWEKKEEERKKCNVKAAHFS